MIIRMIEKETPLHVLVIDLIKNTERYYVRQLQKMEKSICCHSYIDVMELFPKSLQTILLSLRNFVQVFAAE